MMLETSWNVFGDDARFHHVGIAVQSIEGVHPDCAKVEDETQQVSVAFVNVNGLRFELIEPSHPGSPVSLSLEKNQKVLHVCYEVPSLSLALIRCRTHGFHRISKPVPAKAFDERKIVWVFHKLYGLFELVESPSPEERLPVGE